MGERVVLDPAEVADDRFEWDITDWIDDDGVDWGDAAIEAFKAKQHMGEIPVDHDVPPRTITIPLMLKQRGAVSFETARTRFQAKAARFQQEGGWLKRVTRSGRVVYADITLATLKLGGGWLQAHKDIDTESTLTLEALPDFYEDEVELDDIVETTQAELVSLLKKDGLPAVIRGDYPARCRIVVDNDSAEAQLGLIVAARSRYYDAAPTAKIAYEAEALTPLDQAAIITLSGASGGGSNNAVRHNNLGTNWTPVLSTDLAGTGPLTHTGTNRVRARVHTTSDTPPQVRLVYDVGDLALPTENSPRPIPDDENLYLVDLGEVRLDKPPVGTHRWRGVIQAKGAAGGENVTVDKVWIEPVGEGHAVLRASAIADPGLVVFSARDEFNQSAGALAGKALAAAGVVSGPRSAGTGADDAGIGTVAWSNPGNVLTSNDARATAALGVGPVITHYLKATNFGFAVPAGATISGIVVEIERRHTVAGKTVVDEAVRIVKGGTIQSSDRSSAEAWPTSDAVKTYGSPTDLWGTTWTNADINASTFGVAIAAEGEGTTAEIDHIRITVYYTPSGGNVWAGAGDTDDFSVETTGKTAQRTAVSDTANTGRFATVSGLTLSTVGVQDDVKSSLNSASISQVVLARYVDTSNFLGLFRFGNLLQILKRVAGTFSLLKSVAIPAWAAGDVYTLRLVVDGSGRCWAWYLRAGQAAGEPIIVAQDAALAAGGALDDGTVGIYDENTSASAATRNYDNFTAWVPTLDAVLHPAQSGELRDDGTFRESADGAGWGPTSPPVGDLIRLPPSGLEGRPVELFLKATRGNLDGLPDNGIDDISARVLYRPCHLFVPGT